MLVALIPPEQMRLVLSEYKALGVPFNVAWASALRSLPRSHPEMKAWKKELTWARPAFQAAYCGGGFDSNEAPNGHTKLAYFEYDPEPVGPLPLLAA